MANGYLPTGISTQPIDIVGAGQRLMQTAVEQKLADIEQGRAMADESQQAALEAMSMKTIQGLDRRLQDRYSEQFDQHRQKIVDMLSKSGGVLNRQQQMQIRNEQEDIINRTMADNEAMQARNAVREFLLDPNTQYGYNMDAIAQELSNWDKKFEEGEYLGDPRTILVKHQIEAPIVGYISKNYQPDIESLGKEEWGDFKGNVFSTTEVSGLYARNPEAVDKAIRVRDDIMRDPNVVGRYTNPDGTIDEGRRADVQQRVEDAISKRISEASRGSARSSGSGSGSGTTTQELFPTEIETVRGTEQWYNYPSGVPQTKRTIDVKSAYDVDTGEKVDINDRVDYSVVSFNPENRRVRIQTEGGVVEAGGQPMLYDPSRDSVEEGMTLKDKRDMANSQSEFKKENKAKATLARHASTFENGDEADEVKNVEIKENKDGTFTMSGELVRYERNLLGRKKKSVEKSEKVDVVLEPITDKSVDRTLELDIDEYRGVLSPLETRWRIGNNTVREVLNQPRKVTTFDPTNWK